MKRLATLALITTLGCASTPEPEKPTAKPSEPSLPAPTTAKPPAEEGTFLTEDEALRRYKQVRNPRYELEFQFTKSKETFTAKATIHFDLKKNAKDHGDQLFLDLQGGTVSAISLNGAPLAASLHDGNRIWFEVDQLKEQNTVVISYTHPFSHTGDGLHRFKDPKDGRVYLYSNLEPDMARMIFPCFDQPDLKASYQLTVTAPGSWTVIGNKKETSSKWISKWSRKWVFPPSHIISTYLFALHAGPYKEWSDKAGPRGGKVPMRLFVRRSLAKHIDADDWFRVTKYGLAWFNTTFAYPYPFEKYDQVIVPDFNSGAMENVAAVTFSERYVYRSKMTKNQRLRRASVILHEMAHMWFGNLVTMKWWDDLWLNESFATFAAAWALDEIKHNVKIYGGWLNFTTRYKTWAYSTDQRVTTHPIAGEVKDTSVAMAIFDGITYGKGASALKQLYYFVGREAFAKGLKLYFEKHAFENSRLQDFITALATASGKDLNAWRDAWLTNSGVNTLKTKWACEAGKISSFELEQGYAEVGDRVLRPHRTEIGFYLVKGNRPQRTHRLSVAYSGANTPVPEAVGKPCPDFVYPNEGDYDYVKTELDPTSMKAAHLLISKFEDPLTRTQLWRTLWEMVVDGKLPNQVFTELVMHQVADEKDLVILGHLHRLLRYKVLFYFPKTTRRIYRQYLTAFSLNQLGQAPRGSDQQLLWFQTFLEVADEEQAKTVAQWLDGKKRVRGLKFSQERRWEMVSALSRMGTQDALERVKRERRRDGSDYGTKLADAAESQYPSSDIKKRYVDEIFRVQGKGRRLAQLRNVMWDYWVTDQEDWTKLATGPYFSRLDQLKGTDDVTYITEVSRSMFPRLCNEEVIDQAEGLLSKDLPEKAKRNIREGIQGIERCMRARRLAR